MRLFSIFSYLFVVFSVRFVFDNFLSVSVCLSNGRVLLPFFLSDVNPVSALDVCG